MDKELYLSTLTLSRKQKLIFIGGEKQENYGSRMELQLVAIAHRLGFTYTIAFKDELHVKTI